MKRFVSFMLIAVLCLGILAACGKDADDDSASSGNAVVSMPSDIFSTGTVRYVDSDGAAIYSVARASDLSDEATAKALDLYRTIRNLINDTKSFKNYLDEDQTYDAAAYEILIGNTNRPESKTAYDYLVSLNNGRNQDFIIATVGNKVVINAVNEAGLVSAIQYYIDNYVSGDIEGGIYYANLTEASSSVTINGTHLGQFKIIRPVYNSSYITQMQIDAFIDASNNKYLYAVNYYNDRDVEESDYEIIVGNADRDGVDTVTDRDEYTITVSGSKVYLNGGSPSAIAMAVSEFTKLLEKGTITDADSVSGSYSTATASYDAATNYKLTWSDDFDGTKLDTSKWFQCYEGWYSSGGQNNRTSIRTNDPKYVYVSDGKYYANAGYDDEKYYGNMLLTNNTMLFKYGYVEISAILPHGSGLWTALWLDSRHSSPVNDPDDGQFFDMEIDVNECFGNANMVAANCHRHTTASGAQSGYTHFSLDGQYSRDKVYYCPNNNNFNQEMHTFGCLWDEDEFTFTCDGEAYFSWKNNETDEDLDGFHQLCFLRLSTAVGFASDANVIISDDDPAWTTSNAMIVDYMHIYQLQNGKQKMLIGDGNGGWR